MVCRTAAALRDCRSQPSAHTVCSQHSSSACICGTTLLLNVSSITMISRRSQCAQIVAIFQKMVCPSTSQAEVLSPVSIAMLVWPSATYQPEIYLPYYQLCSNMFTGLMQSPTSFSYIYSILIAQFLWFLACRCVCHCEFAIQQSCGSCRISIQFPKSEDRDCEAGREGQYIKVMRAGSLHHVP
jgi:hypothetical protein